MLVCRARADQGKSHSGGSRPDSSCIVVSCTFIINMVLSLKLNTAESNHSVGTPLLTLDQHSPYTTEL